MSKNQNVNAEDLINDLSKNNLPSRPFFYPLSSLPAYKQRNIYETINTNSYDIYKRAIVLPSALNLNNDLIDFYCEKLIKILKKYNG